jgi:hypothetical protein
LLSLQHLVVVAALCLLHLAVALDLLQVALQVAVALDLLQVALQVAVALMVAVVPNLILAVAVGLAVL